MSQKSPVISVPYLMSKIKTSYPKRTKRRLQKYREKQYRDFLRKSGIAIR